MKTKKFVTDDVGAISLGCMGMSFAYGAADNEHLLAEDVKGRREKVFLVT